MKKLKILITGSTGYIGFNFINKYYKLYDFYPIFHKKKISKKYFKKSIRYQNKLVHIKKFILTVQPDITIHLATNYQKFDNEKTINKVINTNILFGSHLLEALKHTKSKMVINIGTVWQNKFNSPKYIPANFYASTKEAFEKIAYYYHLTSDLSVLNLKLTDSYGGEDNREKIIPKIINSYKRGKAVYLDNKNYKIGLIHIDDICLALKKSIDLCLDKKKFFLSYALIAKKFHRIIQIIQMIENIKKIKIKTKFIKKNIYKKQIINKSLKVLPGWRQKISLLEGLSKLKI